MRECDGGTWLGTLAAVGWSGLTVAGLAAWSTFRRWQPTMTKEERREAREELRELSDPLQALCHPDRPTDR